MVAVHKVSYPYDEGRATVRATRACEEHNRRGTIMFKIGDRVKVLDQNITGEIVRWDGAQAVVLDDDRADWIEEGDDGTLVFRVSELGTP